MSAATGTSENTTILRRKDLAARFGVSTVTIWRMRDELPPSIQISKQIRGWRESDIATWLETRRAGR